MIMKPFNQHDLDTAYIQARHALQENPDNLSSKILIAEILIELKRAIEQGADINLLIAPLGKGLLYQGTFSEALEVVKNDDLGQQGKIAFALVKANAYQGLKDSDKAKLEYLSVLNL